MGHRSRAEVKDMPVVTRWHVGGAYLDGFLEGGTESYVTGTKTKIALSVRTGGGVRSQG